MRFPDQLGVTELDGGVVEQVFRSLKDGQSFAIGVHEIRVPRITERSKDSKLILFENAQAVAPRFLIPKLHENVLGVDDGPFAYRIDQHPACKIDLRLVVEDTNHSVALGGAD